MPEKLHFLTAGDGAVTCGLAAVVGSILRVVPQGTPFAITIVDGGMPAGLKTDLARAVAARPGGAIEFVPFRWPAGCKAPPLEGSQLAYARLFAAQWVKGEFCLYIDCDTVLRENPAELFAQARSHPDVPLWAARNYPHEDYREQLGRQSAELIRDVPAGTPYFNSGVLLINLGMWRQQDLVARCLQLAAQYQFIAHDQDALNVYFRGAWKELPERWNHQLYERYALPSNAALLHYSGRNKPWHFGYPAAARQPFVEALSAVGWKNWTPPVNLKQWLRNSRFRPVLSKAQYWMRRSLGGAGVKRR